MKFRLNRSFLPWIIFQLLEYWYYYLGALVCLYLLHYFQSTIPILAKGLGDKVLSDNIADVSVIHFILLSLSILVFRTLSRLLFFYPARAQQKDLRIEMVKKLETSFPFRYNHLNDGELFQVIVNDINRLRALMGFGLLQFGNIIIASFIFIPKIIDFNPDFLIAFSPLLLCIILFTVLIYFFQPYVNKGMEAYAQLQNYVIESYEAKQTIKNFHAEKSFLNKFKSQSEYELDYFFKSTLGRVFSFPMIKLGIGASLLWGTYIVSDNGLSASDLIFFSGFLYLILEPLLLLSWIGIVASQGFAAWKRIKVVWDKIYENEIDPKDDFNETNIILPLWNDSIALNLKKDAWNVIVGDTGAGKSYLLEQISNEYHRNGVSFSFIQQEPYLYNDTILNNIILNNEVSTESMKLIEMCIQEFGLDVLGRNIDEVLNLEIGENGKKISGGQAKRVALIRSLVSDVDYIIWDDPFSSVDLILESEISNRLKSNKLLKNKTFIICSHRISSVKNSNRIFFIDKHKGLVESGDTESIFKEGSKVYEYFKQQMA